MAKPEITLGRRVNLGLLVTTQLRSYQTLLLKRGHSRRAAALSEGRVYPERYEVLGGLPDHNVVVRLRDQTAKC